MNLSLFLLGYRRVGCGAHFSAALLDLCMRREIFFTDFCGETDGSVSFCLSFLAAKRLLRAADAEGITLTVGECRGLPAILWKRRRRSARF